MNTTADQIFKLSLEIHRAVRHRFAGMNESPWKINPLQLFALVAIHDQEGITMRELATHLKITSPSATAFADRLVKYRWIERKQDQSNRKIIRLCITDEGEKILNDHLQEKNKFMKEFLGLLSKKDQKELARILQTLLKNFTKE